MTASVLIVPDNEHIFQIEVNTLEYVIVLYAKSTHPENTSS